MYSRLSYASRYSTVHAFTTQRASASDAAETVFFENGVSATTLEQIAGKAEILAALIDRTLDILETPLHTLTATRPAVLERLRRVNVDVLKDFAGDPQKQRALAIVLFKHEHHADDTTIPHKLRQSHRRMVTALRCFFVDACVNEKADIRSPDMRTTALLCYNHGLISTFLNFPETIDLAKDAEQHVDLFFRALRPPPINPAQVKKVKRTCR
jgi:TetR/AcrR family acrAB operon transcriptional repressor